MSEVRAKRKTWPPAYEVDAQGKVRGYLNPRPNNWGRWGAEDERGTASGSDVRFA